MLIYSTVAVLTALLPTIRNTLPRFFRVGLIAATILNAWTSQALAYSGERRFLSDSVRMPSAALGQVVSANGLNTAQLAKVMPFSISLKMRNTSSLDVRLGRGEQISQADMEANYLPAASDYVAMEDWLIAEGFSLGIQDPNHTTVFASGTVSQVETAFGVKFGRVTTADGEFSSALSAPSLPVELSGSTLSIDGLQPHIRMRQRKFTPESISIPNSSVNVTAPSDILAQYGAPLNFNGTGQTIAIIMAGSCSASDYNAY